MDSSIPTRTQDDSPTVLDLFCGAGGLTLGFEAAGFRSLGGIDWDRAAVATHGENFSCPSIQLDLSREYPDDIPIPDVVVGGPPCQGFSSAGMRSSSDSRNDLVRRFAEIVAKLKPHAFVFENVEGFLTADDGYHVMALLHPLIECGYSVHARKVNAANFGVPQHRKRVIVIGGLGWAPSFPATTHTAFGAPGAFLAGTSLPPSPTLEHAVAGLPSAEIGPPGFPQGHFYRPLTGIDMMRAVALGKGQTMRDLPTDLQHQSFARRALRRVQDGTPSENRGGPPSGLRRLSGDEPSKAITGRSGQEFLHPYEHRPLTIRECARIQTFPDSFKFCGTPEQQFQIVGNAVPPLLAEAIAGSLMSDFQSDRIGRDGGLLSFVPTLSNGASPALKRVINAVRMEFGVSGADSSQGELSLWL